MALLKPEVSLSVGLATAVLVYATYTSALPTIADVRVGKEDDPDIDSARKMAAWTAAGIVGAVSLIAKDPTVFVVGGAMVVALDVSYRYADAVNPALKRAARSVGSSPSVTAAVNDDAAYGDV